MQQWQMTMIEEKDRVINIAIIEDNKEILDELCAKINRFGKDKECTLNVFVVNDPISFVGDYRNNFDIIFVSVESSLVNGIAYSRRLRRYDENVIIILTSYTTEAAIEGYAVRAHAYLLKNTDYVMFSAWLNSAVDIIFSRAMREYVIFSGELINRLQIDGIKYVEVQGHILYFYTTSRKESYSQRRSMKDLEVEFAKFGFFKVSKSYLINLKYVTAVKNNCVILGDMEIMVSRTQRRAFKDVFDRLLCGYRSINFIDRF